MLTQLLVSDYFDQILSQFSLAIFAAIHTSHPHCRLLKDLLSDLASSETQTTHLTELAYEWCSVLCKNYSNLKDGKYLLLLSLEIGFCHLNLQSEWIKAKLIHTEHHQELANIIFESKSGEAIADLLCAWTSRSYSHQPYTSLNICAKHLIDLHHLHPFSSRLQKLIIHVIYLISYEKFKQVGVEGFFNFLDDLQVNIDVVDKKGWAELLLDIVQSNEGIQYLSYPYWELLVEPTVSYWFSPERSTYSPKTVMSLKEAEEWNKLECWIGVVWMLWPLERGKTTEEDLGHITLSLFHQQPSAIQKLEQWMEQLADNWGQIPESFQRICKQAHGKAAQQAGL